MEIDVTFCKFKVILLSLCKLNLVFWYKDPSKRRSALTLFIDKGVLTARLLILVKQTTTFSTELQSTLTISNLTGNRLKSLKQSAVFNYLLESNSSIDFDYLDILASEANQCRLLIKGSLSIKHDQSHLKRTIKSFPFKLFEWGILPCTGIFLWNLETFKWWIVLVFILFLDIIDCNYSLLLMLLFW